MIGLCLAQKLKSTQWMYDPFVLPPDTHFWPKQSTKPLEFVCGYIFDVSCSSVHPD